MGNSHKVKRTYLVTNVWLALEIIKVWVNVALLILQDLTGGGHAGLLIYYEPGKLRASLVGAEAALWG